MEQEKQRHGGAAPYGYRRIDDGFEPDPQEASIRVLIFELFLTHKRKLTVAKILNDKGYRTRAGAEFSDSSIDRFLRSPIVKGHHKDNYMVATGIKKYRTLKPESEWRFQPIEPLVTEELWNQVNDLLIVQRKNPAKKKPTGIFVDYLFCHCGSKMHNPYRRRSYYCSACKNAIEVKTIESIFEHKLADFKLDAALLASAKSDELDLSVLQNQKTDLESEMDQLYELYKDGTFSKVQFGKKYKPLEKRLEAVENEIASFETKRETPFLSSLGEGWGSFSDATKRQLIELLVSRISADQQKVTIAFSYCL